MSTVKPHSLTDSQVAGPASDEQKPAEPGSTGSRSARPGSAEVAAATSESPAFRVKHDLLGKPVMRLGTAVPPTLQPDRSTLPRTTNVSE
jgi:hypothetical protein